MARPRLAVLRHRVRWCRTGPRAGHPARPVRRRAWLPWALLAAASACGDAPRHPPNLLLISIDTLRADHLQAYGYPRATAPQLAELARQGALFEQCFAAANWTLPTHCTLFTGLLPFTHGVETPNDRLADGRPTLAEALRAAGYRSAGYVANPFLDQRYGYVRGFDEYRLAVAMRTERAGQPRGSLTGVRPLLPGPRLEDYFVDQTSASVTGLGLAFLDQAGKQQDEDGRPFFLFLHFNDVHSDYIPPAPYDRLFDPSYTGTLDVERYPHNPAIQRDMDARDLDFLKARYDGEIRWVDGHIGQVLARLAELGLADDTLVVVTADHGEGFFEHRHKEHHYGLYAELVHVPWLLRWPGHLPAGRRVPHPVSQADVAPTLLALMGLPPLPDADGASRLRVLTDPDAPPTPAAILSKGVLYTEKGEQRTLVSALRTDRLTVHARRRADQQLTRYEVYDRRIDPDEGSPLDPAHPAWRGAVDRLLELTARMEARAAAHPAADLPDDPELIERMKQWGYIR